MENKYQISFKKLAEVVRNPKLLPAEKILLVDLLLYGGVQGESIPSQKTLAKDLGMSDRYIRTLIVSLHEQKLLNWKKRGYSKSNRYSFNQELYIHIDTKQWKYSSYEKGSLVPIQNGSTLPPNETHQCSSTSEIFADKKISTNRKETESVEDPNSYQPQNAAETAAKVVWQKWEPNNHRAFWTSYLNAAKKGVPADYIYQFSSELKMDSGIKPGAIFNVKVAKFLLIKSKSLSGK